jgi:tRNA dimethylallyltransferase
VFLLTHQPLSILLASAKETPKFLFVNIGLMPNERTWLHERIVQRFKVMLKLGLIEETLALQSKWKLLPSMPASRLVGYRQVFEYLQDPSGYFDLQDKAIFATRQLAKRQLTWLRHWRNLAIVAPDDTNFKLKIQAIVAEKLENKR